MSDGPPARRHPVRAAWLLVATLFTSLALALLAKLAFDPTGSVLGMSAGREAEPNPELGVVLVMVAAATFGGGMSLAVRTGSGRGRAPRRAAAGPPVWRVAEPGADLTDSPMTDRPRGHLEAGAVVAERRRLGSYVLVTAADGMSGWLPAERLEAVPPQTGGSPV